MTWIYRQSDGELMHDDDFIGTGYSGTGFGRNNPAAQNIQNVGCIPRGRYTIGDSYDDPHLGVCVMHLDPSEDTETFGRSAFRIHGDNARNDASHGCVILGKSIREQIADSDDQDFEVI